MTGHPPSVTPANAPCDKPGQADLLRSALALAGRGWHVFPCAIGGKQPALRGNWQALATTDPATIAGWWTRRAYNIGIACGPSGLVVLDLDVPKANPAQPPVSGITSLARLYQQARQPYPSTFTVETPSGGRHLYFAADGEAVPNSASRLGPRIDVRADGGYVVGPGSMISGRGYTVRNDALPVPLPHWITSELRRQPAPKTVPHQAPRTSHQRGTAYATAALREETCRLAVAGEGTRNDILNLAAFNLGQLVAAGLLAPAAVITSLADAAAHVGLPEAETRRTIRSGMTAGARHPRVPRQGLPRQPSPQTTGIQRQRLPGDGSVQPTPRPISRRSGPHLA